MPFPERLFKNCMIWREEHKGRINTNKVREETVTVVWLCRKNEWDKDTEKGARFIIEETWDCLKQVTLIKRKSLLRNKEKGNILARQI
jgi:hypothetical protein